jgi:transketolase
MGSFFNGINYYGYFKTYCSTFLVFSDYLKPALRLSALAGLCTHYIFTHDSIMVGQDGPTHQPIEHIPSLQSVPNLKVIRPASFIETAGSFLVSYLSKKTPVCLILSRQKIINYYSKASCINFVNGTLKGALILKKEPYKLKLVLLCTGSDVEVTLTIHERLFKVARLITIPCASNFLKQSLEYKLKLIPRGSNVTIIESGATCN